MNLNVPTITILIKAHGHDEGVKYKPKSLVRILSAAGVCGNSSWTYYKDDFYTKKENAFCSLDINQVRKTDFGSSFYEMVYIHNLMVKNDILKVNSFNLLSPVQDHTYAFTDSLYGIFLVSTRNNTTGYVESDQNLLIRDFKLGRSDFHLDMVCNITKKKRTVLEADEKFRYDLSLSEIVQFYEDKGFGIINIVDFSCRKFHMDEKYKQEFIDGGNPKTKIQKVEQDYLASLKEIGVNIKEYELELTKSKNNLDALYELVN
jgi:hypothetical protein